MSQNNGQLSWIISRSVAVLLFLLMVNIGQEIHDELLRQERTVSWLARKLGCNRAGVYRMMEKNSIDTAVLLHVSMALKRNFFSLLLEDTQQQIGNFDTEV